MPSVHRPSYLGGPAHARRDPPAASHLPPWAAAASTRTIDPVTSPHPSLPPDLRSQLAKVVLGARRVAEAAARHALQALAVDRSTSHKAMSLTKRGLRDRLQARGRHLGDGLDPQTGTQEIGRLAHEVAYEQWHRMLFARFLAENGLLLEPDHGVPVSVEECAELAQAEGTDRWTVAGGFAARMLPGVFRQDDPVLDVVLAPEARLELEELLESLPKAVFLVGDALGWTYQFWQASRKDEINQGGVKIGADELPAVTQLFTERYMVLFLFHNTIGAWRAGKVLAESKGDHEYVTEEELRRAVRINAGGGYDFTHLRFVRDEGQASRPAAGSFEGWPRTAAELRILDPCCGSGHFLVEGLELLARLRMEEEGISLEQAVRRVLAQNLHGLEIDARCAQIAAFNVAFTAWRLVGRPIGLGRIKVAWCGLAPNSTQSEWMVLADRGEEALGMEGDRDLFGAEPSLATGPLRAGVAALHRLFRDAPELGSLIDPPRILGGNLFEAGLSTIRESLSDVLEREKQHAETFERAVAAEGMAGAVELLDGTYDLVVTNVPFLARGKQSKVLRRFAEDHHSAAKGDLATIFASRILQWLGKSGTQALVAPQNWLFLTTYRKLREGLLKQHTWNAVARLGVGAFETVSGHVVNVCLHILTSGRPDSNWRMAGIDVSTTRDQRPIPTAEKDQVLRATAPVELARQADHLTNPDVAILMRPIGDQALLLTIARGHQGIATGDYPSFGRKFWEVGQEGLDSRVWIPQQSTVKETTHYGGREHVLHENDGKSEKEGLQPGKGVRIQGGGIWLKDGVAVSQIGPLPATLYTGEKFDNNVSGIGPLDEHLPAVWAFCSSPEYARSVREFDQALKVTNATLVKVPFDLEHWQGVAAERYPNGLPEPYSDDPTQWLFHGHPCGSVVWDEDAKRLAHGSLRTDATVLQVVVARLLGFRWPAEHDPELRLADESRAWVERCRQLDPIADGDGIVCIPAVGGERPAQDRLRELLRTAYADCWSAGTERALLAAAQGAGSAPESIEDWLRDRFFEQHCKLFHNRPFVWHVWDGRRDGFHALVNYHRLAAPDGHGRRTLESLAFRYVGDWIERQRDEQREGKAGADARLAAALGLQKQLEGILLGEPPLDIFVRWRPLADQPIGWEPELDDGVRLNIRPFMRAELPSGGRRGAGILRWKPNVKWGKDKGKERPKDADGTIRSRKDLPWFWSCPGTGSEAERTDFPGGSDFDGNRWNDLHYTRAVKEAARAEAAASQAAEDATPSTSTQETAP